MLAARWASVSTRPESRSTISGSVSPSRVSASSVRAPMGVFSSWEMLATKSRRTWSRRSWAETSRMITIVSPDCGRDGRPAPGSGEADPSGEASCAVVRRLAPPPSRSCDRRLDQHVGRPTRGELPGDVVAVDDRSVDDDDDTDGELVEPVGQSRSVDGDGGQLGLGLGDRSFEARWSRSSIELVGTRIAAQVDDGPIQPLGDLAPSHASLGPGRVGVVGVGFHRAEMAGLGLRTRLAVVVRQRVGSGSAPVTM